MNDGARAAEVGREPRAGRDRHDGVGEVGAGGAETSDRGSAEGLLRGLGHDQHGDCADRNCDAVAGHQSVGERAQFDRPR
jgi:hypothetical protein